MEILLKEYIEAVWSLRLFLQYGQRVILVKLCLQSLCFSTENVTRIKSERMFMNDTNLV